MNQSPVLGIAFFALLAFPLHAGSSEQPTAGGVPPPVVADYIHAIMTKHLSLIHI